MKKSVVNTLIVFFSITLSFSVHAGYRHGPAFKAKLSGDYEVPAIDSEARGFVKVIANRKLTKLHYLLLIKTPRDTDLGVLGESGAHLHCAPEGVNGPAIAFLAGAIPGGVNGRVVMKATLTEINIIDTTCGETIEELLESIRDGDVYVNVHSIANPEGEIRGQLRQRRQRRK